MGSETGFAPRPASHVSERCGPELRAAGEQLGRESHVIVM